MKWLKYRGIPPNKKETSLGSSYFSKRGNALSTFLKKGCSRWCFIVQRFLFCVKPGGLGKEKSSNKQGIKNQRVPVLFCLKQTKKSDTNCVCVCVFVFMWKRVAQQSAQLCAIRAILCRVCSSCRPELGLGVGFKGCKCVCVSACWCARVYVCVWDEHSCCKGGLYKCKEAVSVCFIRHTTDEDQVENPSHGECAHWARP